MVGFAQAGGLLRHLGGGVECRVINQVAGGKHYAPQRRQVLLHRHEVVAELHVVPEILFPKAVGFGGALESGGEVDEQIGGENADFLLGDKIQVALPVLESGRKISRPGLNIADQYLNIGIEQGQAARHFLTNYAGPAADKDSFKGQFQRLWHSRRPAGRASVSRQKYRALAAHAAAGGLPAEIRLLPEWRRGPAGCRRFR